MLERLKKTRIIGNFKKTKIGQKVKRTKIYNFIAKSQGNWRYPFMWVTWQIAKVLVPRKKISADGITFTLSCTNWLTHYRWYLFRNKEPEVRHYINNYVKEGDVFFDIGANVGVFSIYSGKRYSDISVYCFEPEYSNLHILKENIICNDLATKTKIYSVAISDFVGVSNLHLQDFNPGSAIHTEDRKSIDVTEEGGPVLWSEGIAVVTLDYICEQLGVIPNTIKIDTDGNEDKILRGSLKTFSDKRLRSLIIEMPQDMQKKLHCREMLVSSGFDLVWSEKNTRNEVWAKK